MDVMTEHGELSYFHSFILNKDSSENKIDDKKNLLINFIFLKVINNIYNACDANHFK